MGLAAVTAVVAAAAVRAADAASPELLLSVERAGDEGAIATGR
jgi:opacity protein-like surface antigen